MDSLDYSIKVEEDAISFIMDHSDEFKEGIVNDFEFFEVFDSVSDSFHDYVTDQPYDLKEAASVITHCRNEETDSGLWEGLPPMRAIEVMAAFSFANDVREIVQEYYDDLSARYEELLNDKMEIADLAFTEVILNQ